MEREEAFYLIKESILPEAIYKTAAAKKLLASKQVATVNQAVKQVGLSRSAFYKYKEGIFPVHAMMKEMIATLSMNLSHRSGMLSKVLAAIAESGGSVLTIHQTIPLQEIANVVMSMDVSNMEMPMASLLRNLEGLDGVRQVEIIGRG